MLQISKKICTVHEIGKQTGDSSEGFSDYKGGQGDQEVHKMDDFKFREKKVNLRNKNEEPQFFCIECHFFLI